MVSSFNKELEYNREKVDEKLNSFLNQSHYKSKNLIEAMRYSVLNGGKKFRSFLLYYIGKRFNIDETILFHIGACVEMIHSYSLVHDDLPAMDDDDMRRGKPSCHKQYDEATAILAGDALLSDSFYFLSSINDINSVKVESDKLIKIIKVVSDYCGGRNLISGQMLDIEFANNKNYDFDSKIAAIKEINFLKTAKIIALSCAIITILLESNIDLSNKLVTYGENLGIIFQLIDDLNDFEEDEYNLAKILGKTSTMEMLQKLIVETDDLILEIKRISNNSQVEDFKVISKYIINNKS